MVQGIPWSYTWKEVKDMFAPVGDVERADVAIGHDGRSRVRSRGEGAWCRGWGKGARDSLRANSSVLLRMWRFEVCLLLCIETSGLLSPKDCSGMDKDQWLATWSPNLFIRWRLAHFALYLSPQSH